MPKRGDHEGTIFKRPNGTWGAALQVGGQRKYVYAKTRKEVQDKLLMAQQEALAGVILPKGAPKTVETFLRYWLDEFILHSIRPKTWDHYDLCIRRMVPYIGKRKLAALSPADIRAMWTRMQSKGASIRTVRHCHSVLHNALQLAVKWRYLSYNPVDGVSAPRAERAEMKTLSAEEVHRLFAATIGDRWHALWVVLATTGLRLDEVTALRWSDLDFSKSTAVIQRSLQRQRGKGLVFVEPKSQSSRRTVQLPVGAVAVLQEHRPILLRQRLTAGDQWRDYDLVFPSLLGGPIDPGTVNSALHTALHLAGLPRIRVHDLRHRAATLLLEQGTHPKIVQDLLGHSSIAITLDIYSHVTPRLHKEAAMTMQNILFETPQLRGNRRGQGGEKK
ncbi:MAG TPA: tyrosine-type recombinase/integrase [Ktedonobacterales bacterium]|jgi:integrase